MKKQNLYLSSNIKYLRNSKGKTQQDLADFCQKANTAISNWEKGIREPDAVDLAKIAKYFNVQIDDLMLKDLRFDKDVFKPSTFHHTDEESGLSVEIIPTDDIDWNSLSKDEQEDFIGMAMDALYEAKKEIKNDKKVGENKNE